MVVILVRRPEVTGSPASPGGLNNVVDALQAQSTAANDPRVEIRPARRRDLVLSIMAASISRAATAARGKRPLLTAPHHGAVKRSTSHPPKTYQDRRIAN